MSKNTNHHDTVKALRERIIAALPTLNAAEGNNAWWLLGTSGCHLCTQAEQLLTHFQLVQPVPYRHVDIADFETALMMEFATTIPVLLTKHQRLNYPFSVMDLQALVENNKNNKQLL